MLSKKMYQILTYLQGTLMNEVSTNLKADSQGLHSTAQHSTPLCPDSLNL